MCRILKNLLSLLLAFSLLGLSAFAQEDLSDFLELQALAEMLTNSSLNLEETSNNSTLNLSAELPKLNFSSDSQNSQLTNSTTLDDMLANQDFLLDNLEQQFQTLTTQVQTLSILSDSLETTNLQLQNSVDNCKATILTLQENITNLKRALESNKGDTSALLPILGEMQEALDYYREYVASLEKKANRLFTAGNILIPIVALPGIVTGIVQLTQENMDGLKTLGISAGIGLTASLVWNGGRFIFKLW